MFCTNCGKEVQEGLAFCQNCGSKTSATAENMTNDTVKNQPQAPISLPEIKPVFCENCGKEVREGLAFCTNCGNKIGTNLEDANTVRQEPIRTVEAKPESDMDVLGLSKKIQILINAAIADGNLETKEIELLRRKAQEFGDDPDVVEMVVKNRKQEEPKPKTITITVNPRKNILVYFAGAMKKYCVFKGRARRAEFWYFYLVMSILTYIAMIPTLVWPEKEEFLSGVIMSFVSFGFLLPYFGLWVRRIHDTGKSAWFILIPIYNMVLWFIKGTVGPNKFGEDPKKPITKEVVLKGKETRESIEAAEGKLKSMERFQAIGGTLISVGGTANLIINGFNPSPEVVKQATVVIAAIGIVVLALTKGTAWLQKTKYQ